MVFGCLKLSGDSLCKRGDVLIRIRKRTIFREQLYRSFFTYSINSRDIIRGVTQNGEIIDYLTGFNAEKLANLGIGTEALFLFPLARRPEGQDVVVDELEQVLVSRDHDSLDPFRGGLP